MSEINYQEWATDLCSLLDEIERNLDNKGKVRELLKLRFEIAIKHGLEVSFLGPSQSGTA